MIGIKGIATHLPEGRIDNSARKEAFGATEDFIQNKLGFRRLALKPEREETSDLACAAVRALQAGAGLDLNAIETLVVVTQNPDGFGLPHTSAVVHGKLDLPATCAAFDISLGCSGWVYGLSVIKSFMADNGLKCGVLVTADPYSKVIASSDRDTAMLFGDAATATLLAPDATWRIGRFDFGTLGKGRGALEVRPNRHLHMNGRAVFEFSATHVPASIQRALQRNGATIADIDRVILHQGSRFIVDTVARRLGAADRTPFVAGDYGNTVSSSIPLALSNAVLATDKRVLVAGFGVGLSYATTVLERIATC